VANKPYTSIDGVPAIMPIDWRGWKSSPTTRKMTDTQVGIAFKSLLLQWELGSIPRDAWQLAKDIQSNFNTTLKFLQTYSKLFVCRNCADSWSEADCKCGESYAEGRLKSSKHENFSIDVNSGLPLGTTGYDRIGKDQTRKDKNSDPPKPEPPTLEPENPAPEQGKPEPESPVSNPDDPVLKLVHDVWRLLGKPSEYKNGETFKRWFDLIEPKVKAHTLEYVRRVLTYAIHENEFFQSGLKVARNKGQDPVEYLVTEKWVNIESALEVAESKAKRKKQVAASGGKERVQGSYSMKKFGEGGIK